MRVVRQRGTHANSRASGLQARGLPRNLYDAKRNKVERAVGAVIAHAKRNCHDLIDHMAGVAERPQLWSGVDVVGQDASQ